MVWWVVFRWWCDEVCLGGGVMKCVWVVVWWGVFRWWCDEVCLGLVFRKTRLYDLMIQAHYRIYDPWLTCMLLTPFIYKSMHRTKYWLQSKKPFSENLDNQVLFDAFMYLTFTKESPSLACHWNSRVLRINWEHSDCSFGFCLKKLWKNNWGMWT